jgi:hypothetical protein
MLKAQTCSILLRRFISERIMLILRRSSAQAEAAEPPVKVKSLLWAFKPGIAHQYKRI